ncbi:MAG: hypothetical protein ACYDCP_04785 [Thermoplasmataceae archaeon]
MIWNEIWRQFEEKGITVKSGTIQDATFIESDPGKHGKYSTAIDNLIWTMLLQRV